jgi:hypothetical protein
MSSSDSVAKGKAPKKNQQKRMLKRPAPATTSEEEGEGQELTLAQAMSLTNTAAAALHQDEDTGVPEQGQEQGEEQETGEQNTSINRLFPTLFTAEPARGRLVPVFAGNAQGGAENLDAGPKDILVTIDGGYRKLPKFTDAYTETENERVCESIFNGVAIVGLLEDEDFGGFNAEGAERLLDLTVKETDENKLAFQMSGIPVASLAGAAAVMGLLAAHIKVLGASRTLKELNVLVGTLQRVGDKFLKDSEGRAQQARQDVSGGGSSSSEVQQIEISLGGITTKERRRATAALAGTMPMDAESARFVSQVAGTEAEIGGGQIATMAMALVETNLGHQIPEAAAGTVRKLLALGRPTVPAVVAAASAVLSRDPDSVPTGATVSMITAVGVAVVKSLGHESGEFKARLLQVTAEASMQQMEDPELALVAAYCLLDKISAAREDSFAQKKKTVAEKTAMEAVRALKVHDFVLKGSMGRWPPGLQKLLSKWRGTTFQPAAQGQGHGQAAFTAQGQGHGQAAFPNNKKPIVLASARVHCVPFQNGTCTGTSTATCPQNKTHVIVKCRRPYTPGGKCFLGAACHFAHI